MVQFNATSLKEQNWQKLNSGMIYSVLCFAAFSPHLSADKFFLKIKEL